jgi:hypothetical protein
MIGLSVVEELPPQSPASSWNPHEDLLMEYFGFYRCL